MNRFLLTVLTLSLLLTSKSSAVINETRVDSTYINHIKVYEIWQEVNRETLDASDTNKTIAMTSRLIARIYDSNRVAQNWPNYQSQLMIANWQYSSLNQDYITDEKSDQYIDRYDWQTWPPQAITLEHKLIVRRIDQRTLTIRQVQSERSDTSYFLLTFLFLWLISLASLPFSQRKPKGSQANKVFGLISIFACLMQCITSLGIILNFLAIGHTSYLIICLAIINFLSIYIPAKALFEYLTINQSHKYQNYQANSNIFNDYYKRSRRYIISSLILSIVLIMLL